jgi:hypothetical protein
MGTSGKSFTNSSSFGERDKYLLKKSANSLVIHMGCTDWPNQIEQISSGSLLHSKITANSKQIIGLDVDSDGIEHLSKIYPSFEFIIGDISDSQETKDLVIAHQPNLILIPDVIEHIENQRSFLNGLHEILLATKATAIITTPNAYALKTFIPSLIGRDFTHTDHCLVHNEFTLRHVLIDSNFKNIEINYLNRIISGRYGKIAEMVSSPINLIARAFPHLSDTLVAEFST